MWKCGFELPFTSTGWGCDWRVLVSPPDARVPVGQCVLALLPGCCFSGSWQISQFILRLELNSALAAVECDFLQPRTPVAQVGCCEYQLIKDLRTRTFSFYPWLVCSLSLYSLSLCSLSIILPCFSILEWEKKSFLFNKEIWSSIFVSKYLEIFLWKAL